MLRRICDNPTNRLQFLLRRSWLQHSPLQVLSQHRCQAVQHMRVDAQQDPDPRGKSVFAIMLNGVAVPETIARTMDMPIVQLRSPNSYTFTCSVFVRLDITISHDISSLLMSSNELNYGEMPLHYYRCNTVFVVVSTRCDLCILAIAKYNASTCIHF